MWFGPESPGTILPIFCYDSPMDLNDAETRALRTAASHSLSEGESSSCTGILDALHPPTAGFNLTDDRLASRGVLLSLQAKGLLEFVDDYPPLTGETVIKLTTEGWKCLDEMSE